MTPTPPPNPNPPTRGATETAAPADSAPELLSVGAELTLVSRGAAVGEAAAGPGAFGGYAVERKIGEGGMGAVYLAEDTRLGRKVAIKTMKPALAADPSNRGRFEREARAAAAVEHENIVPIWQVGEAADGTPFIVMPFLQGETLDARLRREAVSPLWLVAAVGRDVAAGLSAAHAKGLIHRDIKPGNVWLEGTPAAPEPGQQVRRAKVLDFGLARPVEGDDTNLTATGLTMGTPAYMAPEQARGEGLDQRSDLFSLGVLLYRMAAGRQPFKGSTTMAVLCSLVTDTPAPLCSVSRAVPAALGALVDQLLQKDPAARPPTADEVAARFRQLAAAVDLDVAAHLRQLAGSIDLVAGHPRAAPAGGDAPWAEPVPQETAPHVPPAPPAPRREPVSLSAGLPPRPAPGRVPLPLALLFLLLVAGAGVAVLRYDVLGLWGRPGTPTDPTPQPKVEFRKPDAP